MKWYTTSFYYDMETGEFLTKERATKEYYIIEKKRDVKYNTKSKTGTITYANKCRKRPEQTELF